MEWWPNLYHHYHPFLLKKKVKIKYITSMVSHFIELLLQVNKPEFFFCKIIIIIEMNSINFHPNNNTRCDDIIIIWIEMTNSIQKLTEWIRFSYVIKKTTTTMKKIVEQQSNRMIENCPATPEYKYTKGGYYLKKSLLHFIILMMMMMIMTDSGNQYFLWKFFHSFLVVVVVDISSSSSSK